MVPRPLQKLRTDSPLVSTGNIHKFLTFDHIFYAFPNWYKVGEKLSLGANHPLKALAN